MKETRLINRFSGKISHLGNWVIFDPNVAHPQTLDPL